VVTASFNELRGDDEGGFFFGAGFVVCFMPCDGPALFDRGFANGSGPLLGDDGSVVREREELCWQRLWDVERRRGGRYGWMDGWGALAQKVSY
jgi:hypothetical protein